MKYHNKGILYYYLLCTNVYRYILFIFFFIRKQEYIIRVLKFHEIYFCEIFHFNEKLNKIFFF